MKMDHRESAIVSGHSDSGLRVHMFMLLAYSILTIIFTYPVAFRIFTHIPKYPHIPGWQPGDGDPWLALWLIKWIHNQVLSGHFSTFNDVFFYPIGVNMPLVFAVPYLFFIPALFVSFLGPIAAYNVGWLCPFVLSGYGTWLLVEQITGNRPGAFAAGIAYSFSHYHLAQGMEHFDLINMQWIPLFLFFFHRAVQNGRSRDSLMAAFMMALCQLSVLYYAVYLAFFSIIYFLYLAWEKSLAPWRRLSKSLALMLGVYLVLTLPFQWGLIHSDREMEGIYTSIEDSSYWSADLLAFLAPPPQHSLLGSLTEDLYGKFTGNPIERVVYPGFVVLAVALLAVRQRKFWAAMAILFGLLSLGPYLHIGGRVTDIPLPYYLFHQIPLVKAARVPSRFAAITMLCLAVLMGSGVNLAWHRWGARVGKPVRLFFFALFLCALGFEQMWIPYPTLADHVPEVYKRIAQEPKESGTFSVVDVPMRNEIVRPIYYQLVHGGKLVTGHLARYDPFYDHVPENVRFIEALNRPESIKQRPLTEEECQSAIDILDFYRIKYIVLHRPYMPEDVLDATAKELAAKLPVDLFFSDHETVAFRVRKNVPPSKNAQQVYLLNGWGPLEVLEANRFRWAQGKKSLMAIRFPKEEVESYDLQMKLLPAYYPGLPPQRVDIELNGMPLTSLTLKPEYATYDVMIPSERVHPGMNAVLFRYAYWVVPYEQTGGKSPDMRKLTVSIDNISLHKRER